MQSTALETPPAAVLVLGTGGTIAGIAPDPAQAARYTAAQLGVQQLVDAVPALRDVPLRAEQLAQIDSKDMAPSIWTALARRIAAAMVDAGIAGIVVTHGTDTLEETATLLARLFGAAAKPVVLTAAMRPANAPDADGPGNLADAVAVARSGVSGVFAVMHGRVWDAARVRKLHTQRLDAFGSAQARPRGRVEQGRLVFESQPALPAERRIDVQALPEQDADWPRVEIVTSHAGADGRLVDLLVADGVRGLVLAGTGQGTLHRALEAALHRATAAGVRVVVASRVGQGVVAPRGPWPTGGERSPAQARVALMLDLLPGV
jgi:L-asparaginase